MTANFNPNVLCDIQMPTQVYGTQEWQLKLATFPPSMWVFILCVGGRGLVGARTFLQNAKAHATRTRKGLRRSQSTFAKRLQTEDIFLPVSCTGSGGHGNQCIIE